MISVEIKGVNSLKDRLLSLNKDVAKDMRKAVNQGASMVQSDIFSSLKRKSLGKIYKRGNITHQASKPGDAPNNDRGNLYAQILVSPSTRFKSLLKGYSVEVSANTKYARRLEYGGSHTAKNGKQIHIAPRPFVAPALAKNNKAIKKLIAKALKKSMWGVV